ncbi:MAG: 4-hydroxy-tetrahydrodipicolinate synthase [Clostridiaceae bacterium]|nr:4-hydroxy-tetrahydrodipicolinate synthase [Clostridiaceae bacterium]
MKTPVFRGAMTALATPFDPAGRVDYTAYEKLIDRQLALGCGGLAVCATTGEGSTLEEREFSDLVECAVSRVGRRVPVAVGAGGNNTRHALALCLEARRLGADALLLVTPYYNKTTQYGLIEHYTYLADRSGLPILLYNVPSRTGMRIEPETCAVLAQHPMICGIKEAGGDFSSMVKMKALCPPEFALYSGNDDQVLPILALGGLGVISTVGNLIPREMSDLCTRWENGDHAGALALQTQIKPLVDALFCAVNPVPLKAALEDLGLCCGTLRLPLCPLDGTQREKLRAALRDYGLL